MNKVYQYAETVCKENFEEVKAAINRILTMFFIAENEGLLALEPFILEEEDFPEKGFVQKAVGYICDAMDADDTKDLLANRILTQNDEKKQFICLLYRAGAELIQKGKHFYFRVEYLCSMFPENYEDEIRNYMNQITEQEEKKRFAKKQATVPEKFAKIGFFLSSELKREMELFGVKVALTKDDTQIQEWLRQMNNYDVCSLLLAGEPELREAILSNMSSRLKIMVMEDVIARAEELNVNYDKEVENIKLALSQSKAILDLQ